MTGSNTVPFTVLADGLGELLWIVFIFGLYAAGAIAKMFSKRKGEAGAEESTESSYVVELAKKRARQRQQQAHIQQAKKTPVRQPKPLSEWDQMQEARRQRRVQQQQQVRQSARPAQPAPSAYQQPRPVPQPVRQPQPARKVTDFVQEALSAIITPQMQTRPRTVQEPRPKRRPVPQPAKTPSKISKPSGKVISKDVQATPMHQLQTFLRNPHELRSAIILKEILDKPIALREDW